jgi:eukaryotic-like serine/threonine-protein kinase
LQHKQLSIQMTQKTLPARPVVLQKLFKSSQTPATAALKPGMLLADRYLLQKKIGQGAMGQVFLAHDTLLGDVDVAVKILSQHLHSPQLVEQFAKEAKTSAQLGHQSLHIIRVLDFGTYGADQPFYVMEFIRGQTLEDVIKTKPLPYERLIHLMVQVCHGLHTAHQGLMVNQQLCHVVHRDIKPSNIFVSPNDTFGEMAKLLDFGVAALMQQTPQGHNPKQSIAGTLAYIAPELFTGAPPDPRIDIYSLGITMFELLTGHLPIQPANNQVKSWIRAHTHDCPKRLSAVVPGRVFPAELETLIQRCIAKKPAQRPQSVDVIRRELMAMVPSATASLSTLELQDLSMILSPAPTLPSPPAGLSYQATVQLSDRPLSETNRTRLMAIATESRWPAHKPIGEIVFAQLLEELGQSIPALWVMLANAKHQKDYLTHRYTEFLFPDHGHPMIGWITALYDDSYRFRCLPCFLDLTQPSAFAVAQRLAQASEYQFILFDTNQPDHPVQINTAQIQTSQRLQLAQYLSRSNPLGKNSNAQLSKQQLKEAYQQLKITLGDTLKNLKVA